VLWWRVAFLLKPLSWLPYYSAYLVFQCISLLCVILFLRTFTRTHKDLLPLALMSPPLIANFILGQDVTLLLGFLTIAVLLTRQGATSPLDLENPRRRFCRRITLCHYRARQWQGCSLH